MKVIGAKSLVQIMPSVVVAKQRVTPGVYEYDSTQPPLISCDGATPSARFSSTGNNINNSGYNLIINDVFYRDFNWDSQGETSYLEHVINTVVPPNTLEIEAWIYDGATWPTDWTIKNISNENLRILIAPWTSACDFEIHPENENPTILSPNEGLFQFCLSPMSNQIGCEGATPEFTLTTTCWGEHTTPETWFFRITDSDTGSTYVQANNNDLIEGEDFADMLERLKSIGSPFDFVKVPESATFSIVNRATTNTKIRIVAHRVDGATAPVAIEIVVEGGSPAFEWIINEYENYVIDVCLSPPPV